MNRIFIRAAAILAALAVIIGAMGTHLLKNILAPAALESVKTAANYQMIHSIALIIVGILSRYYNNKKMLYAGYAFFVGILFFSGSIYLMATFNQMGLKFGKIIALITPLGGLMFISGWILLVLAIPKRGGYVKGEDS